MNEKQIVERFERCVRLMIELESMKAANYERMSNGEALAYNEEAMMSLVNELR